MKKNLFLTALALGCLLCACTPKDTPLPRARQKDITADESRIDRMFYDVYHNLTEELHSLMIVQDGKVIYEKYSHGHDEQEQHVLWSATKTFTATAVGFARQDGVLDVDDPILKFFREDEIPTPHDPRLDSVTVHHLLTMSSGIDDAAYNYEPEEDGTVDPVRALLGSPMRFSPGTRFAYNSNDSHLAGIIVSRATGRNLREYLDEKLLRPLGIREYDWLQDPAGHAIGGFGLYMRTESIAKMAQFMLQRGEWKGKRLLGEDWFDMAMTEQIYQGIGSPDLTEEKVARSHRDDDWGSGYGYQMWMNSGGRGCRLDGANGQFGIILPEKNAVVAITSKCWNTGMELKALWDDVYDQLGRTARFTPLTYEADGEPYDPATQYRNPILPGFYPDPSICRVGDDYYMVQSSFQYFPGIPVWHSTDLIHWESCGYVLDNPQELRFDRELMQFGIFAPHISYNPFNKKFYVVCTMVNGPLGTFFATSDDPLSGRWSRPVRLPDVFGIDPSFLFDTDGKAYLTTATGSESAGLKSAYPGENAIPMWEFDWEKGVTKGPFRVIARAGVHPEQHPSAFEGPHLYHLGDRYFLMCAEGGTELPHCEVILSGDSPYGPFTPCPVNPILTQRDLPADRDNPVSCTGHADLVQTAAGNWYAVFLGCQSYEKDITFNTGRQTFLLPVQWVDGQPVILPAGEPVPTVVPLNDELRGLVARNRIEGFDAYHPGPLWNQDGLAHFAASIRGDMEGRTHFRPDGKMDLACTGDALDELGHPSAVLERITGKTFRAETVLEFTPEKGSEAGLLCWHDDDHYMKLTKTLDAEGRPVLRLEERGAAERKDLYCLLYGRMQGSIIYTCDLPLEGAEATAPLSLRVEATDPFTYVFSYAPVLGNRVGPYKTVGEPRDGRHLSTLNCGGFQGAMVGVYAH